MQPDKYLWICSSAAGPSWEPAEECSGIPVSLLAPNCPAADPSERSGAPHSPGEPAPAPPGPGPCPGPGSGVLGRGLRPPQAGVVGGAALPLAHVASRALVGLGGWGQSPPLAHSLWLGKPGNAGRLCPDWDWRAGAPCDAFLRSALSPASGYMPGSCPAFAKTRDFSQSETSRQVHGDVAAGTELCHLRC